MEIIHAQALDFKTEYHALFQDGDIDEIDLREMVLARYSTEFFD
jgi:hypothetical protein